MFLILLLIIIEAAGAAGTAWLIQRSRRNWSSVRIILISALPIPAVMLGICTYVFADATLAPPESCGVDACAMAAMAATFGAACAVILYLFGLGFAALAVSARKRPIEAPDYTDVFS